MMPSTSNCNKVLLLDIGNSALKFVLWDIESQSFDGLPYRWSWPEVIDSDDCKFRGQMLLHCLGCRPPRVLVSSVHRGYQKSISKYLLDEFQAIIQVVNYDDIPLKIDLAPPVTVGIDRLLAAYAAGPYANSNAPYLTLQIGTAITFDLVSADRCFQGGVILPSAATLFTALAEKTDQLPNLQPSCDGLLIDQSLPGEIIELRNLQSEAAIQPPGKNTIDAMRCGITNCIWGGIERTYRDYVQKLDQRVSIVATGGGSGNIASGVDLPIIVVSNLVLKGLSLIVSPIDQ